MNHSIIHHSYPKQLCSWTTCYSNWISYYIGQICLALKHLQVEGMSHPCSYNLPLEITLQRDSWLCTVMMPDYFNATINIQTQVFIATFLNFHCASETTWTLFG